MPPSKRRSVGLVPVENFNRAVRGTARLHDSALIALKYKCGKHTGAESTSVNSYPVSAIHHAIKDRMTVHDHLGKRPIMVKETIPDPQQIRPLLFLDRNSRINRGVDKQIISGGDHFLKRGNVIAVALRHQRGQDLVYFIERQGVHLFDRQPVAEQRFTTAVLKKVPQGFRLIETLQKHLFVIAGQHPDIAVLLPLPGTGKHPCAVLPAIHQIAQQNDADIQPVGICRIMFDGIYHRAIQVEPSVNISDHIIPGGVRNRWQPGSGSWLGPEQVTQFVEHIWTNSGSGECKNGGCVRVCIVRRRHRLGEALPQLIKYACARMLELCDEPSGSWVTACTSCDKGYVMFRRFQRMSLFLSAALAMMVAPSALAQTPDQAAPCDSGPDETMLLHPVSDHPMVPALAPVDDASVSHLASLDGFTLSANAALATQYRFRGSNLSGDQIAVQGGVDLDHAFGFYAGVWGSRLNSDVTGYGGLELDVYGGYNWRLIEGVTADVGVIAYTFPDAQANGLNFVELYSSLTFTLGPASAKAGLAWDPGSNGFAFAGFARDNLYLYSDLSVGVPSTPLTLKAHLGYTDGTRRIATNSGTFDWSIGASYKLFGPISASLDYVDAAADVPVGPINPNRGNLVGRISVNF